MGISPEGMKIGLRSHPINSGGKHTGKRKYGIDQKICTCVEILKYSTDMATKILLDTLKGYGFTSRYGAKVRSTLVISHNQYPTTKKRIIWCSTKKSWTASKRSTEEE